MNEYCKIFKWDSDSPLDRLINSFLKVNSYSYISKVVHIDKWNNSVNEEPEGETLVVFGISKE